MKKLHFISEYIRGASLALALLLASFNTYTQNIIIDEDYDDWSAVSNIYNDEGDNTFLDIQNLQISNDQERLFLKIKLDREINLQENNQLQVIMDLDNNPDTGDRISGMGIDLYYSFGQRIGRIASGQIFYHNNIGLISAPTVTSDVFEIGFSIDLMKRLFPVSEDIAIAIRDISSGGDILPSNTEGINYSFNTDQTSELPICSIERPLDSELRVLSYNVKRDDIFDSSLSGPYTRILNAIDADILCFQEIYDRNAPTLLQHLENLNILDSNEEWYASKDGPDLITVSKYPIIDHREIDGNSVVKMQTDQGELVIFNCHLPCCDNDQGRVTEIDAMLGFLSASLREENDFPIYENTPIIITGDMNFVGEKSQVQRIINGDILANFIYGEDIIMDYGDGQLTDAKPLTCGLPAVYTWVNNQGSFPPGRLDYLFYTDSVIKSVNGYVLNTPGLSQTELNTLGLSANDSSFASDHLPLVIDFSYNVSSSLEDKELMDQGMLLYPNPSNGRVFINDKVEIDRIEIHDMSGKLIYAPVEISHNNAEINMSHLPRSSYSLSIINRSSVKTRQVILE